MSGNPTPSRKPAARAATQRRRKPLVQTAPDAGQEPGPGVRFIEELRRGWRGIAISLLLHIGALVLLALIPILLERTPPIGIINLAWASLESEPPPVQAVDPIRLNTPVRLSPNSPSPPQQPMPRETDPEEAAQPPVPNVQPATVTGMLAARAEEQRNLHSLATRDAVNEDARAAIDRSLAWLKRQQAPDGRWSLDGPYSDGATRTRWSTDVGATALALLAFLGDGHTHRHGDHADSVARGLKWLVSTQRPSGEIYDGNEEGEEPSIYSHSIATIVLSETLALTGDDQFRQPAEHAVQFLIAAQNPVLGGWRYRPLTDTGEGDLSVTGWALMALHTARMAGIEVPGDAFLVASSFVDRCQESPTEAAFYKYTPTYPADREQRLSMTASGLLARQWLGWPSNYPPLLRGRDFLLSDEARPQWDNGRRNVYGWFYAAEVLHNLGGDGWRQWFAQVQSEVLRHQQTRGKEAGSWHPTRPAGSVHEWSAVVGRLYVTVMCTLILETPFRHQPLYELSIPAGSDSF